jgi:hypothetical protein
VGTPEGCDVCLALLFHALAIHFLWICFLYFPVQGISRGTQLPWMGAGVVCRPGALGGAGRVRERMDEQMPVPAFTVCDATALWMRGPTAAAFRVSEAAAQHVPPYPGSAASVRLCSGSMRATAQAGEPSTIAQLSMTAPCSKTPSRKLLEGVALLTKAPASSATRHWNASGAESQDRTGILQKGTADRGGSALGT